MIIFQRHFAHLIPVNCKLFVTAVSDFLIIFIHHGSKTKKKKKKIVSYFTDMDLGHKDDLICHRSQTVQGKKLSIHLPDWLPTCWTLLFLLNLEARGRL